MQIEVRGETFYDYQNDLSELKEPLKALLQEVMNSDSEADVIEEARHLLEAYMEIE